MQAAFIVDDVEAAALRWVRTTGIGPFLHVPHIQLAEYDYRGERRSGLDFSVALAQSGGVQIELIQQHCDNPSAYRDTIDRMMVETPSDRRFEAEIAWTELRRAIDRAEAGMPTAPRRLAGRPAPSRYTKSETITEKVPQK